MRNARPNWEWIDLLGSPKPNYESIWELQKNRLEEIAAGESPQGIILCEHELIATEGRRSKPENIVDSTIPHLAIERGGDVTLHQPGQLVIYPLLKLHGDVFPGGLHEYLRFCEEIVIQTLQNFEIEAGRWGPTGVWVKTLDGKTKKIASIGIAVRKWITYHGISLNVSNDLREFSKIRPCNFDSSVMTSMREQGAVVVLEDVVAVLRDVFANNLADVLVNRCSSRIVENPCQIPLEVAAEG